MKSQSTEIRSTRQIDDVLVDIDGEATKALNDEDYLVVSWYRGKKNYSKRQRGAFHVWCDQCADYLNEAGYTRKSKSKTTGEAIDLPWSKEHFKAFYKDVLYEYSNALSTEQQSSSDPSEVQNIIINYFAEKGASLPPWPSLRS